MPRRAARAHLSALASTVVAIKTGVQVAVSAVLDPPRADVVAAIRVAAVAHQPEDAADVVAADAEAVTGADVVVAAGRRAVAVVAVEDDSNALER